MHWFSLHPWGPWQLSNIPRSSSPFVVYVYHSQMQPMVLEYCSLHHWDIFKGNKIYSEQYSRKPWGTHLEFPDMAGLWDGFCLSTTFHWVDFSTLHCTTPRISIFFVNFLSLFKKAIEKYPPVTWHSENCHLCLFHKWEMVIYHIAMSMFTRG